MVKQQMKGKVMMDNISMEEKVIESKKKLGIGLRNTDTSIGDIDDVIECEKCGAFFKKGQSCRCNTRLQTRRIPQAESKETKEESTKKRGRPKKVINVNNNETEAPLYDKVLRYIPDVVYYVIASEDKIFESLEGAQKALNTRCKINEQDVVIIKGKLLTLEKSIIYKIKE